MKASLIIPAGGIGKRFGSSVPKQYLLHKEIPLIIHTLMKFENIFEIKNCIISADEQWLEFIKNHSKIHCPNLKIFFTKPGVERMYSVYNALIDERLKDSEFVLIHDAVRPKISIDLIKTIITRVKKCQAVIPVIPITDTVKKVNSDGIIMDTLNRNELFGAQTPQAFNKSILISAFEKALKDNYQATDDASIMEYFGAEVYTISGETANIKITSKEDLENI